MSQLSQLYYWVIGLIWQTTERVTSFFWHLDRHQIALLTVVIVGLGFLCMRGRANH
jgi:hypothetical protein